IGDAPSSSTRKAATLASVSIPAAAVTSTAGLVLASAPGSMSATSSSTSAAAITNSAAAAGHSAACQAPPAAMHAPGTSTHVSECVVDGLEAEVRVSHAEPEPILVAIGLVGPLPVPDVHHLHPGPLLGSTLEASNRVARLQTGRYPPESLHGKTRRVHIPTNFRGPYR